MKILGWNVLQGREVHSGELQVKMVPFFQIYHYSAINFTYNWFTGVFKEWNELNAYICVVDTDTLGSIHYRSEGIWVCLFIEFVYVSMI